MNDEQCHVCGSDPGIGSHCSNCGARKYRYATDEAHDHATRSADISAELGTKDLSTQIAAQAQPKHRHASLVEPISVTSHTAQRPVARTEGLGQPPPVFGADGAGTSGIPGPNRSILLRLVVMAILLTGLLVLWTPEWQQIQEAAVPSAVTPPTLNSNRPLANPQLLTSWTELSLGQCFLWSGTGTDSPTVVDCRSLHDAEISGVATLTQTSFNLTEECLAFFSSYVGETFQLSQWRSDWISPSSEEWDAGVRDYRCFVFLGGTQTDQRAYQSGT